MVGAWLRSGAAAAVVAVGCRTVPASRKAGRAEGCALPPVRVATEREIRTIAGLRPFRPSGFVVRTENWGDTRIIHNYGHGGGGITLSWGTARLAVDMLPARFRAPVGVLGCGVVGLATARLLQEAGLSVTIYARDLPPNTTSNVAGGQWFPFFVSDSRRRTPEFLRQLVAASEYAYRRFQVLVGSRYGVAWIRNYVLAQEPPPDDSLLGLHGPLRHLLPELKDLEPSEHPESSLTSPGARERL